MELAGWVCAAWAVLGPWCEIYLALGLEQGLLVEFRKDMRPEGRLPDHWEADHGKGRVERVDRRAANSLILNGGYSHHLSSHTLSPIGNSTLLGTLRDRLKLSVVSHNLSLVRRARRRRHRLASFPVPRYISSTEALCVCSRNSSRDINMN